MVVAALRDRIEVRRTVRTSDGMGGFTEAETVLGKARGRIAASGRVMDEIVAERLGGRPPYEVVLDGRAGPAVRVDDVLVGPDGRRYIVISVSRQGRVIQAITAEAEG